MNEKELIDRYFKKVHAGEGVCIGVGDDAAVLNITEGHQLVVSTDCMVEGRHFLTTAPPYYIGYKLMAVNLSDMAAMGALPKWVTLNLTLPLVDEIWLKELSNGFLECAEQFNVLLIGGDLTSGAERNISAQIIGEVPNNSAITRSNAHVDDLIFVTGQIGIAGNALQCLLDNNGNHDVLNEAQVKALYQPVSRVALGIDLRKFASSAIDISDGLLHEVELLCQESNVGAEINLESLPVESKIDSMKALVAGDDYELVFTAHEKFKLEIEKLSNLHSCSIAEIGKMNENTGSVQLLNHGEKIAKPNITGFDHFVNARES